MTTFAKSYHHVQASENTNTLSNRYNAFIKEIEFSHYGIIAMAILIGSCLGSITTMQIFQQGAPLWQFIVSLAFTMANLVACIAQAPTKWVVNFFAACILVNGILLAINIL